MSRYLNAYCAIFAAFSFALASSSSIPWQCEPGVHDLYELYPQVTLAVSDQDIGRGSTGKIRLDVKNGSLYAIKVYEPGGPSSHERREHERSVRTEHRIGSMLSHINIVKHYSLTLDNFLWSLTMEHVPFVSSDLMRKDLAKGKSWTFLEISCFWRQILDAVSYMHVNNIAHRDLKFENVLVDRSGVVKLIDFGSASVVRNALTGKRIWSGKGQVGTQVYMAPEVYNNEGGDLEAADVWSMAIMFCAIWIQRYPWEAPVLDDVQFARYIGEVTDDTAGKPLQLLQRKDNISLGSTVECERPCLLCQIPAPARRIIGRMLEVDPAKRATMDDVYADLWMTSLEDEFKHALPK